MAVGSYLVEEVHEAAVGLHLVLQLVEDDERGEGKPSALWKNNIYIYLLKLEQQLRGGADASPPISRPVRSPSGTDSAQRGSDAG